MVLGEKLLQSGTVDKYLPVPACTIQQSLDMMRACNSADIGTPTNTTHSFSSTCVILALVSGLSALTQQSAADPTMAFQQLRSQRVYLTVNICFSMHPMLLSLA